jgi:hypothetical protein
MSKPSKTVQYTLNWCIASDHDFATETLIQILEKNKFISQYCVKRCLDIPAKISYNDEIPRKALKNLNSLSGQLISDQNYDLYIGIASGLAVKNGDIYLEVWCYIEHLDVHYAGNSRSIPIAMTDANEMTIKSLKTWIEKFNDESQINLYQDAFETTLKLIRLI